MSLTVLTFLSLVLPTVEKEVTSFAVVGYLPEWRYEGANWRTLSSHLSHLLLFSAEPTPSGGITGLDRFPRPELLADARAAAAETGMQLLLCFGGNGRSAGFSPMVRDVRARARFVKAAVALVKEKGVHGIDLNWEYPGYVFGQGYGKEAETEKDYIGLAALAKELRAALPPKAPLTLAYYPDGTQEAALVTHGISASVDYMHAMTYDAPGEQHSTMALAEGALKGATAAGLPLHKVTIGLPFYGRAAKTGEWTTFEDLVQRHEPLSPHTNSVRVAGDIIGFNGIDMIAAKTRLARSSGAGGVMVWEVGQDCRQVAVTHGDKTHGVTCPHGAASSLLVALTEAAREDAEL